MHSNISHRKQSGSLERAAIVIRATLLVVVSCALSQCSSSGPAEVVVSVKDQKLGCYHEGKLTKEFKISTSKFGIGDQPGSCRTPLGTILATEDIQHVSRPTAFFRVHSDARMEEALGLYEPWDLYGRRSVLWTPEGVVLADVVEILPPA